MWKYRLVLCGRQMVSLSPYILLGVATFGLTYFLIQIFQRVPDFQETPNYKKLIDDFNVWEWSVNFPKFEEDNKEIGLFFLCVFLIFATLCILFYYTLVLLPKFLFMTKGVLISVLGKISFFLSVAFCLWISFRHRAAGWKAKWNTPGKLEEKLKNELIEKFLTESSATTSSDIASLVVQYL